MSIKPGHGFVFLLLGMAAVSLTFLYCFGVFDGPDVKPLPFEAASWKRTDPIANYRTVRSQMVDDLMHRKLLDRLSRSEVEQLLGPPMANPPGTGADGSRWDFAYRLGLERAGAFSLDDEFLVIRFDSQGRVVEYRTTVN